MRLRWSIIVAAAWLICPAVAQTGPQQRARSGEGMQQRSRERRAQAERRPLIDRLREELDLDEDQLVEFDRIADEFRQKRGRGVNMRQSRALMEEMRRARKDGDQQRVAEIREELKATRGRQPVDELLTEVEGILRDDQREKLDKIRQELSERRRPGSRGPLAQIEALRSELKLSDQQTAEYDKALAELRVELQAGASGGAEIERVVQELIEAAEAGDQDRIEELRKQIPDPRRNNEAAVTRFLTEIESFLEPDQIETLDRFRQKRNAGRSRIDLQACFRFVGRLDLDREQREQVRELQKQARDLQREMRRDPRGKSGIDDDVLKQLRELLTDEQVAKFDAWLERQQGERPGRGGRTGHHPRRDRPRGQPAQPRGEDTP